MALQKVQKQEGSKRKGDHIRDPPNQSPSAASRQDIRGCWYVSMRIYLKRSGCKVVVISAIHVFKAGPRHLSSSVLSVSSRLQSWGEPAVCSSQTLGWRAALPGRRRPFVGSSLSLSSKADPSVSGVKLLCVFVLPTPAGPGDLGCCDGPRFSVQPPPHLITGGV